MAALGTPVNAKISGGVRALMRADLTGLRRDYHFLFAITEQEELESIGDVVSAWFVGGGPVASRHFEVRGLEMVHVGSLGRLLG